MIPPLHILEAFTFYVAQWAGQKGQVVGSNTGVDYIFLVGARTRVWTKFWLFLCGPVVRTKGF